MCGAQLHTVSTPLTPRMAQSQAWPTHWPVTAGICISVLSLQLVRPEGGPSRSLGAGLRSTGPSLKAELGWGAAPCGGGGGLAGLAKDPPI